jgi:hypothetical protein
MFHPAQPVHTQPTGGGAGVSAGRVTCRAPPVSDTTDALSSPPSLPRRIMVLYRRQLCNGAGSYHVEHRSPYLNAMHPAHRSSQPLPPTFGYKARRPAIVGLHTHTSEKTNAAAERVVEAQASARTAAHHHSIEAARAAMATTEQCLNEEDRRGRWRWWRRRDIAAKASTPSPPTTPGRSARRTGGPSPPSLRTPSAAVVSG